MELLKMIGLISLRLLGMTSVFIAAAFSPDAIQTYLSSAKKAAMDALPFCVKFFSDIGKSISDMMRYDGTINMAVASALILTLLIMAISLIGKKAKG